MPKSGLEMKRTSQWGISQVVASSKFKYLGNLFSNLQQMAPLIIEEENDLLVTDQDSVPA